MQRYYFILRYAKIIYFFSTIGAKEHKKDSPINRLTEDFCFVSWGQLGFVDTQQDNFKQAGTPAYPGNNSYRNAQKYYFYIFLQRNLHILKISSTFAENF